jgi:hypothetical protein
MTSNHGRPFRSGKSAGILLAVAVACSSLAFNIQAEPVAEDYLGAWNVLLENIDGTFRSCWIEVRKDGETLDGSLLWRWGSVTPVAFVKVEDGELIINRPEGGKDVLYRARLVDGELQGSVTMPNGEKQEFIGRRDIPDTDISGTWVLRPTARDDADQNAEQRRRMERELKIEQDGQDVTVSMARRDGSTTESKEGSLEGDQVKFVFEMSRNDRTFSLQYSGQVKGDRIEGIMQMQGGDRDFSFPWVAERQRDWGEPVVLFDGKTLDGWHQRDASREFKWKVAEDSSLQNTPPDDDIVSDAKFKDFKLRLEYKVAEHSNSGVYLRGRYELQVLDDYGKGISPHGNGAVYSRVPAKMNVSKAPGEWQTLEVTMIGRYITVVLNGTVIHDNEKLGGITGGAMDPWQNEPGPLLLQGDHGLVNYRNIQVWPAE